MPGPGSTEPAPPPGPCEVPRDRSEGVRIPTAPDSEADEPWRVRTSGRSRASRAPEPDGAMDPQGSRPAGAGPEPRGRAGRLGILGGPDGFGTPGRNGTSEGPNRTGPGPARGQVRMVRNLRGPGPEGLGSLRWAAGRAAPGRDRPDGSGTGEGTPRADPPLGRAPRGGPGPRPRRTPKSRRARWSPERGPEALVARQSLPRAPEGRRTREGPVTPRARRTGQGPRGPGESVGPGDPAGTRRAPRARRPRRTRRNPASPQGPAGNRRTVRAPASPSGPAETRP